MYELTIVSFAFVLSLSLISHPSKAQDDPFAGVYVGNHWSGPVFVEVSATEDAYVLRFSSLGAEPLESEAEITDKHTLSGAFTFRMLGFRRSDDFSLTRTEDGYHFRTKGVNVAVEPHTIADDTPLAQEWAQGLAGRRLIYTDSGSSGGGSGSHFSSDRGHAELCSNGMFEYSYRSSFSANVPGMSAFSDDHDAGTGLWRVISYGQQPVLEFRFFDGRQMHFTLAPHPDGVLVDNRRCFVQPAQRCW